MTTSTSTLSMQSDLMDKFFQAFDKKVPSADTLKQILGNLPWAGGRLLDITQYGVNP